MFDHSFSALLHTFYHTQIDTPAHPWWVSRPF